MFTEYDTGERELYDLNADPYQLESIKQTDAPQLYSTLQSRLNALRDCSREGCRSAEGFPDTTAPKVNNTSPANNATGVSRTANVTATFSEPMDEASVEAPGVVTLKKSSGGAAVAASVTYNPTAKKVILNPNLSLARNTLYSAEVTTGATDLAGNQLDQNSTTAGNQAKSWQFITVQ